MPVLRGWLVMVDINLDTIKAGTKLAGQVVPQAAGMDDWLGRIEKLFTLFNKTMENVAMIRGGNQPVTMENPNAKVSLPPPAGFTPQPPKQPDHIKPLVSKVVGALKQYEAIGGDPNMHILEIIKNLPVSEKLVRELLEKWLAEN